MRICIDATRKLIRGKKVLIEGGESRWIFFKYERLPNFCYRCGMLDHGEKDYLEKKGKEPSRGEQMQYRAWMKGEPGRCLGQDYENKRGDSSLENRDASKRYSLEPSI